MQVARVKRVAAIALRNFLRFRLQSGLVLFAASIGVAGVIAASAFALGGREKIDREFYALGTNLIVVAPRPSASLGQRLRAASQAELTIADYTALKKRLPRGTTYSATVSLSLRLKAGDQTKTVSVIGCEPDYFSMKHWPAVEGVYFGGEANRRSQRVVLLGSGIARDLFGAEDPTGSLVTINHVSFVIVGVLAERGQRLDTANEDGEVYVPLQTAMHRLSNMVSYGSLVFDAGSPGNIPDVVRRISGILSSRHRNATLRGADFRVEDQKSLVDAQVAAFARFTFMVRWIALSIFGVSALGAFGVSWIAVGNRVIEIGTRRAIGGTRGDILFQFFLEGALGCAAGCTVSFLLSYPAVLALDSFADQPFAYSWRDAGILFAGSTLLFSAFAAASAGRAVSIDPMLAMRAG